MSDFQDSSISDAVTDDAFEQALTDDTPDVPKVADDPASSSETVENPEADTDETQETEETETVEKTDKEETDEETPKVDTPQETTDEAPAEPLDWKTAPEQFREKYEEVKTRLKDLESNSLQDKFLTGAEPFLEELSELSSSQFQHVTQEIVKRGIETQPNEFAEYLAKTQPDAIAKHLSELSPDVLAQTLFGEGVTAEKAQKIIRQVREQDLEEFLDDGTADAPEPKEAAKPKTAPKADAKPMTPDEIDKLVEAKIAEKGKPQAIEALKQKTYADIMAPVEASLAEAGLAPLATDTAEEKKFKEWVSSVVVRDTFDHLFSDDKNAPKAKAAVAMIEALDEKGVEHLKSTLKIIAEDYAGERIEMLTAKRAENRTKPLKKPKEAPKKVPATGSVPSFGNGTPVPSGRISEISESDFESAGM